MSSAVRPIYLVAQSGLGNTSSLKINEIGQSFLYNIFFAG